VIGVAAIGAVTLAPALLSVGGAAYSGVAELLGFAGADAIKDAVVPVAEGGAEGAGDAAVSGGSDAVGQAPANAPDLSEWDDVDDYMEEEVYINADKPDYMIAADQADFIMSKEGIATVKDPKLKAQLEEVSDFRFGSPNDADVLGNFNKIKNYAPTQMVPEDVVTVLSMNIRAGTSSGLMRGVKVANIAELRLMVIKAFQETGMITEDGANQYLADEKSGVLDQVVTNRNEAIENDAAMREVHAGDYAGDTSYTKIAKYISNNKAQLARDFAENYWQNVVVMATVMPLWDYLSRRGKWFQYPVMATVSTTAISNLLSLTNNYGNMNSIYSPPSTLSPVPASYTSHTAGSWIVTTVVTYSPAIQVNVDPVFTAFKEAVKQVLGEITYHKADLSFTHSTTKKSYNKLTFKLTMNRDYESVTTQEKEILTNTIDAKLSEELDQYVLTENPEVTTTTTTTPPNNPAIFPQLLGGGRSAGYSPKLVLLSEGGADRAQSRFMLRTGWNNALDSRNSTSFASVNNTGNKNFVRDSSNFIKYRKLRAINQNYNDLKK
jgi:hypothetical protein